MRLADIRHWVFDMDGTLTRAVHDFPAICRSQPCRKVLMRSCQSSR
ncbi:hypothetical protein ACLBTR_28450, partial [Pseudomonas aeruginosa]